MSARSATRCAIATGRPRTSTAARWLWTFPCTRTCSRSSTPRLAERGATAHEIMAITGHRSLEEVERYTRAARQGRLADAAMMKFKSRTDSVPPK